MGKVKFSFAISEIRNKVGGSVYSRNKYGSYVRAYVIPQNNNTPAQAAIRLSFGEISEAWKTLTDNERQSWSNTAAMLKKTDIFSNQYSSNGFQFFMQLNTERVLVGSAISNTPPALSSIPSFNNLSVFLDTNSNTFTFDALNNQLTSNQAVVIKATPKQSLGQTFFKNKQAIISVIPDGTTLPYNAFNDYITKYSAFFNSTRVGWQVYVVDKITGLRSLPINGYSDPPLSGFSPIASAYFAELPTQPSDTRKSLINNYIVAETSNSMAIADRMFLLASEFQDNSYVSVVYPMSPVGTSNGGITWSTLGWLGNAAGYFGTSYTPMSNAINLSVNSAWLALYINNNVNEVTNDCGSGSNSFDGLGISLLSVVTYICSLNDTTQSTTNSLTTKGLYVLKRNNSLNFEAWKDGILIATITSASTSLSVFEMFIAAYNKNSVISAPSNKRYPFFAVGGGNLNVALFSTNTINFLTAIGAN